MSPVRLASRNPFETVVFAASLFSLPGALGLAAPPASVVAQLGPTAARWWMVFFSLAGLIALVGLLMESPRRTTLSVNGLLLEQIGCVLLGWSCMFYAAAAFGYGGTSALAGAGLILGFGVASFVQAFKIENVLRSLRGKPTLERRFTGRSRKRRGR